MTTNRSYETFAAEVGGLTEQELTEMEDALAEQQDMTDQDIEILYLESQGFEHEQNI